MSEPRLLPRRMVSNFSDELLAADFPRLPSQRRADVIDFVLRRVAAMPSPMRVAVGTVAAATGVAGRTIGMRRVAGALGRWPVPVFGEYVRLVRSLAHAYIWERWPTTGPDGAPRDEADVVAGTGADR